MTTTIAHYLVKRLHSLGVQYIFSVPGDYLGPFLETVDTDGSIKRVGNPNEQEAAYAADGYAKQMVARNKFGLGVVATTYGVGSFSALNAVTGGFVEGTPVLLLNGAPDTSRRERLIHQGVISHHLVHGKDSNLQVFRNVTIRAERIENPAEGPRIIDALLTAAITYNKPVYLEVPRNIWEMSVPAPQLGNFLAPVPLLFDQTQAQKAALAIRDKLNAAQSPVIWAGVEVRTERATPLFQELVEKFNIPFATQSLSKGLLDESHGLFRGVYSGNTSAPGVLKAVEEADLVIGLGVVITDIDVLGQQFTEHGLGKNKNFIFVQQDTVKIGMELFTDVPVPALLEELIKLVPKTFELQSTSTFQAKKVVQGQSSEVSSNEKITYDLLFSTVGKELEGSVVLSDASLGFFPSLQIPVQKGDFVCNIGWASIGYTAGALIGAKAANPEKLVVAFVGDGGFQQGSQALSTMARLQQNNIVFLLNNGVYGIEQWLINFEKQNKGKSEFLPFNILPDWDYEHLAGAFRCAYKKVETVGDLANVIQEQKSKNTPLLVDVRLDKTDLPATTQWTLQ